MFDQIAYLADQFRKYFPDSSIIVDNDSEEEVIIVTVHDLGEPLMQFRMEIGSDDPWYQFTTAQGVIITVPFSGGEGQ